MPEKIKEAPVITFRLAPHILKRLDALVASDKIKYINRSVVIKRAIRAYVTSEELNNCI